MVIQYQEMDGLADTVVLQGTVVAQLDSRIILLD